jgi:hypothetical protein
MMSPEEIGDIGRKKIRYVLFQAKRIKLEGGKKLDNKQLGLTSQQVSAIEKTLSDRDNYNIRDFAVRWDLGIDDPFVMGNRGEKYWLFGIRPHIRVERPTEKITILNEEGRLQEVKKVWSDSVDAGRRFFKSIGYIVQYGDGPHEFHLDYDRIMEDVDSRTTWLRGEQKWQ